MNILQPSLPKSLTQPADVAELFEDEDTITDVAIDDADMSSVGLDRKSVADSLFSQAMFTGVAATSFDASNCIFKTCDFSAARFPESSWHRTTIDGARCSGMQIVKGKFKNVTIKDSKLEIVNFRFSNFEHVIFQDCVLNDVDFYGAQLKNVAFISCSIRKITFGSGRLFNVDVSVSTIEGINGIGSLKGVTMSYDQVMQLAPVFAAEAGINIK